MATILGPPPQAVRDDLGASSRKVVKEWTIAERPVSFRFRAIAPGIGERAQRQAGMGKADIF